MKLIISFFVSIVMIFRLFPVNLIKINEMKLKQNEVYLTSIYGFCVSNDNRVIFTDWKAGNIKIFNNKGDLVNVYGQKGFGPGEFAQILDCDISDNLIIANDNMTRKISILKLEKNNSINLVKRFRRKLSILTFRLRKNTVLCSGWSANKGGRIFELYSFDIRNHNKIDFLVPAEIVYGLDSFDDFKRKKNDFDTIAGGTYCDFWDKTAFVMWPGSLNVTKIDLISKKIGYLRGEKSKKYIKPFRSQKLLEAIMSRDLKKFTKAFSEMSIVKFFFVGKRFYGIIYNIPSKQRNNDKEHICQFYDYSGKFINEVEIDGEYLSKYYFSGNGKFLYSLHSELRNDLDEDIVITKYKIVL